jgi:hypothetical protein
MEKLISTIPNKKDQTLLVVGHHSALESCTRHLYNGQLRRQRDFDTLVRSIPYLATVRMSERSPNRWQMSEPIIPLFTHAANDAYRWEAFGDANEMRKVLKK